MCSLHGLKKLSKTLADPDSCNQDPDPHLDTVLMTKSVKIHIFFQIASSAPEEHPAVQNLKL